MSCGNASGGAGIHKLARRPWNGPSAIGGAKDVVPVGLRQAGIACLDRWDVCEGFASQRLRTAPPLVVVEEEQKLRHFGRNIDMAEALAPQGRPARKIEQGCRRKCSLNAFRKPQPRRNTAEADRSAPEAAQAAPGILDPRQAVRAAIEERAVHRDQSRGIAHGRDHRGQEASVWPRPVRGSRMIAKVTWMAVQAPLCEVSRGAAAADRARGAPKAQRCTGRRLRTAGQDVGVGAGWGRIQEPGSFEAPEDFGRVAAGKAMEQKARAAEPNAERGAAILMGRAAAHPAVARPAAAKTLDKSLCLFFEALSWCASHPCS